MGIIECSQPASKSSWDSQDFGVISMMFKMAHFRKSTGPLWPNSLTHICWIMSELIKESCHLWRLRHGIETLPKLYFVIALCNGNSLAFGRSFTQGQQLWALQFLCFSLNHILNKQSNGRHQSIIIYDNYMLLNVFLIENRIYCDKCQTVIINAHALLSMK